MMRRRANTHASPPRRFRGFRPDCAVCRCAGDRQLRDFREAVGNRTEGDGVLAWCACAPSPPLPLARRPHAETNLATLVRPARRGGGGGRAPAAELPARAAARL